MLLKNSVNKSSASTGEDTTKDKKMQWLDYEFKRLLQKYIKSILAEQENA